MRRVPWTSLPRPLRLLLATEAVLLFLLASGTAALMRSLPTESVKLHGNIDTGVDLLGQRTDVLWIALFGLAVTVGNAALAAALTRREPLASLFLLATSVPVLVGLLGALVFLRLLNSPR